MRPIVIHLLAAFAVGITAVDAPGQAKSEWVYPGSDGKLVYKTTDKGDRVLDFSHAGYMGGGVAIPDVAVKKTIQPSGAADDAKLIQSAVANATDLSKGQVDVDALYVKTISVDQGPTLKRFMPRAMGRATPIHKKSSHVHVVLADTPIRSRKARS